MSIDEMLSWIRAKSRALAKASTTDGILYSTSPKIAPTTKNCGMLWLAELDRVYIRGDDMIDMVRMHYTLLPLHLIAPIFAREVIY